MATMLKVSPGSKGLLSPLLPLLNAQHVSELLINKVGEVWIEDRDGMVRYEKEELTETYLNRLFTFIANENNQVLSESKPFLSGSIFDGSRVQLVIPPASKNHVLSIRKKSLQKLTFEDYESRGFFEHARWFSMNDLGQDNFIDEDEQCLIELKKQNSTMDFLKKAIELHKNIILSGGTSTGKTTCLNTCVSYMKPHESQRIITIEDTLEIDVPHLNQVNLMAPKNSGITMQDCLAATLRLRPDRVIMGEIRGPEILDFIAACSTGHDGSIATIHANNPRMAIQRMIQLYKQNNVPAMRDEEIKAEILSVVDIIIQLKKHPRHGRIIQDIWYKGDDNV